MKLVTLATLRADTKLLANQRSSAFVTDPEVNRLVNLALAELYDLLVLAGGHEYYEQTASLSTTPGSAIVALPADMYRLITVIANWGPQQLEELDSLNHLGDQVPYRNWNQWDQYTPKAWRMRGQLLEFFPTPTRATALELRYVPAFQDLANDAATFDGVNGWDRMVSARAAMELLALQALPAQAAEAIYLREHKRIEDLADQRACANPVTIRDVKGFEGGGRWWRRVPWPVA